MNIKAIVAAAAVVLVGFGKIASGAGGFVAGHAIVTAMQPSVHDRLVEGTKTVRATLPKRVDDVTVLTDQHVEGNQLTFVYDTSADMANADTSLVQGELTRRVCGEPSMRRTIENSGVSYRYEYWRSGQLVGHFEITSCPVGSPA